MTDDYTEALSLW